MTASGTHARPGLALWWSLALATGVLLLATSFGPLSSMGIFDPALLCTMIVVGAGGCLVGAGVLTVIGWRGNVAEQALLGSALGAQALLGLTHGLLLPGALTGENMASITAAFLALPVALVVAVPLWARHTEAGALLGRHWRGWVAGTTTASAVLAAVLLVAPGLWSWTGIGTRQGTTVVVGLGCLAISVGLSLRHLRLYWVGRVRSSLVASLALLWMGATGLVWIGTGGYSFAAWIVQFLDIVGVGGAAIALCLGFRFDHSLTDLLAPVITCDPLVALDLGLSPTAHQLVAMLDDKDPITRDHVIRVGELAVRAGEGAGLRGRRLRALAIGALFHDIGKVEIPDAVLKKPGKLDEDELAIIRRHPAIGESMLLCEPELAGAAPLVRWHHERVDGAGYPDCLAGDAIPLEVSIISAADAFDAMCHTRQYRTGLGPERALAILIEYAGSQWSPEAVSLITEVVRSGGGHGVLNELGRVRSYAGQPACGCADSLPAPVRLQVEA